MKNGFYLDLPNEDYHSDKSHMSASQLKPAFKSITHFFAKQNQERKKAFDMGNAFEALLIEPHKYKSEVAVFDEAKRPEPEKTFATKGNREYKNNFFEANAAKSIITKDEEKVIKKMIKSVKETTLFFQLLKNAAKVYVQPSLFWTDKETKVKFKSRPDIVVEFADGSAYVIDVKTAEDGSPEGFTRDLKKFNYPIQAITQIDGVEEVLGLNVTKYFYLVAEKALPNNATIYEPFDLEVGPEVDYTFQQTMRPIYKEKLLEIKRAKKDIRIKNGGYGIKGNAFKIVKLKVSDYYYQNLSK